jgi:lipopolysaccharide assembly outer membrane protein LptD (OstA)
MYFGGSSFASSPFGDPGGVSVFVTLNGQRMNFAIGNVQILADSVVLPTGERVNLTTGNVEIKIGKTVIVTGAELALANNVVNVINWNPIPPGASQIWVPIDPDNP